MSKRRLPVASIATTAGAVLLVLVAMLWFSGVFRANRIHPGVVRAAEPPATGPARTIAVEKVARPAFADVVGSIQSVMRTDVSSRIVANILEVKPQAGERVKRGDLLVQLDDAPQRSRVQQARETLRAAEASRQYAQQETDRRRKLPPETVSASEREQWESKLSMAVADVARAQQAVLEAESALDDARLLAPFDGIIIDRLAEPGEQASPGKALLSLYDPNRLRLEAAVREGYIGKLKVGQKVTVHVDSIDQDRQGTVEQIVPAADPESRSFLVKVPLENSEGLYPGMYAHLRLPLGQQESVQIPLSAVKRIGQITMVEVLDNGRLERRTVRLGPSSADRVEILAGLSVGEQVVVP